MKPKTLIFPYLPELDIHLSDGNVDAVVNTLDSSGVRQTIDIANWENDYPYRPLTAVTVAHSGTAMYLDFFVRCNYMRAVNTDNQSAVSEDSCVEFFVSPESDSHYWNFEFNCIGTINASHRTCRNNPTRLSEEELNRIVRYPSCGTRPFCELEGLFTWNLLVVIPLSVINTTFNGTPIEMTANFYKCATKTSAPHYLSWSPVDTPQPDFHKPEFFGKIRLENK